MVYEIVFLIIYIHIQKNIEKGNNIFHPSENRRRRRFTQFARCVLFRYFRMKLQTNDQNNQSLSLERIRMVVKRARELIYVSPSRFSSTNPLICERAVLRRIQKALIQLRFIRLQSGTVSRRWSFCPLCKSWN